MTHAELVGPGRAAGRRAWPPRASAPGDAVALLLPNDPTFVASYYAISGARRRRRAGQPRLQAGRAGVLLPPVRRSRAVISDERSAGVCERIVAGWDEPAQGDHHQRGARAGAHARHADGVRAGQARAALARRAARLPVLVGLHRPPEARGPHARAVRGEAEYYPTGWGSGPRTSIFCAIPLFHTYGMGCCMFAATRTGATLVMLEDPNPFLLRRQRALELLEHEGVTIFPGVPFNFRLMAEAPAVGRPVRRSGSASPPAPRCRGRSSTPSSTSSACPSASSTAAPRPGTLTANLDDDPVATLRVGRHAGGRGARCASRTRTASRCPPAAVGEVAVQAPGAHGRLLRHGGAQPPGLPRGLLPHRRPRASSTRRAGSRSPGARSC